MYPYDLTARIFDYVATMLSVFCAVSFVVFGVKEKSLNQKLICFHLATTMMIFCYLQLRWILLGFEQTSSEETLWAMNESVFMLDIILLFYLVKKQRS